MEIRHPIDDRLPAMLRSGKRLRGVFNALPHPGIVEMCAYAGFDFIVIDNEHGSAGFETTENMLRAARGSGIVPIVRCFGQDIPRLLDMGANAVQVPMVETAEQARALVQQLRYPPLGRRGSAFSPRAAGYGAFPGAAHTLRSNEGIAFIAMIETPAGVAQAAEIAAVPGVDAVFVGPNDLSHAMGAGSDWRSAPVLQAMETAIRAVASTGKCAGTLALKPDDEERFAAWGTRLFANTTTGLMTEAFRSAARAGQPGP